MQVEKGWVKVKIKRLQSRQTIQSHSATDAQFIKERGKIKKRISEVCLPQAAIGKGKDREM